MLLIRNGSKATDVDRSEISEAFAAQILCNIQPLGIPEDRLNIGGGGIALGHPIGARGARVLTTLIHHLHRRGGMRGICLLCRGGGNAVSMLIERVKVSQCGLLAIQVSTHPTLRAQPRDRLRPRLRSRRCPRFRHRPTSPE
ncbi:MAG: hypothetical protein SGJ09_02665 [Phycisphaerae bacterium]|nr:hypothetical protein [Phycisphaerae bacterium]